jgi:hypothetical protein
MELNLGGAQIRLMPGPFADADKCVHFFRTEADHAARPMIFEAAPEQALAIGHDG